MAPTVKTHISNQAQKIPAFNLEQKVWVIEKLWEIIWIQRPKLHKKETIFLMGQNLCWQM